MTKISGINQDTFLSQTQSAIETFIGSPVKSTSKIRQFITEQFKLQNEHVIPGLFSESDRPVSLDDMEQALLSHDFKIFALANGKHAIADPIDDDEGFYLELEDRNKLIVEAYNHIILPKIDDDNDNLERGNGEHTSTSINRQLDDKTQSHMRQRDIIMDFIEKNGLMNAFSAHIEAQEIDTPHENLKKRFLHDVDCLVSGLHEFAQRKAEKVVNYGMVTLEDHYTENGGTDFTISKAFVCALGSEMEFQYRPLSDDKMIKKAVLKFKQGM